MRNELYIIIELGAACAAIIAFIVTFLTMFRKLVLDLLDRDIDRHLAKRDASVAKYARQARDAAKQAAETAREARETALQAKHETRRLSSKIPDGRNAYESIKPGESESLDKAVADVNGTLQLTEEDEEVQ